MAAESMNETPDKPSEYSYRDYIHEVEIAAEAAIEAHTEYSEDYPELDDAVRYAIRGDSRFTNYGHKLMTVLLSDQDPDNPDYCSRWRQYVNLEGEPTWSDCVSQMAWVCYYSDVMDRVVREMEDEPEESVDSLEEQKPIATWVAAQLPSWKWEAYEVEETDAELVTDVEDGEAKTTTGTIYFGRVKSPNTYDRWEIGSFSSHDLEQAGAFRTDEDTGEWPGRDYEEGDDGC